VGVHWEDSTDADKFDIANREERAKSNGLPPLAGAVDLAKALDIPITRLRWLAFHREVDTGSHYRRWLIPSATGAPGRSPPRSAIEARAALGAPQRVRQAPRPRRGPRVPLRPLDRDERPAHAGADTVVKVDIKDFFPTVTWRRVRGLLRKAGMAEGPATILALLSTEAPREVVQFRGKTLYVATGPRVLPQGAPTSPAITNALCLRLDRRVSGLAKKLGFRYTRYADDLTLSWRSPAKPEAGRDRAPPSARCSGASRISCSPRGFEFTLRRRP
jgi:hypothetical protein